MAQQQRFAVTGRLHKADEEKRIAYYWASVIEEADGATVVDLHDEVIEVDELEKAAHEWVATYRTIGYRHRETADGVQLVAALVTTRDLQKALGLPAGVLPVGLLVGLRFPPGALWEQAKGGDLSCLSIGGYADREEIP